jgi:hypothetical protein
LPIFYSGFWAILFHAFRWNSKIVRDESPKGSDVIGFCFEDEKKPSPKDALAVFESKASFSGSSPTNPMQDAINDSAKTSES